MAANAGNIFFGFAIGVAGFLAAMILSSLFLVPLYLQSVVMAQLARALFIGPITEELIRVTILKNSQHTEFTPPRLRYFAAGWFLCELGFKIANGTELGSAYFFGIGYLGVLQPLALHILFTYTCWGMLKWTNNIILASGAAFVVHVLYNVAVLVKQNVGLGGFEMDDIFTVCAVFAIGCVAIRGNARHTV